MSGRDRFLDDSTVFFCSDGSIVSRERRLDIYDEVVSIADQISMLSDLTYQEAYTQVMKAVMEVYEAHRKA